MGAIRKQSNGRYDLDGQELTSGDVVQLLGESLADRPGVRRWLHGRIEHRQDMGYYFLWPSVEPGKSSIPIQLMDGMRMRRV